MKKYFAIAALMMLAALPASAQFSYGIKAGLNMSRVSFSKNAGVDRDTKTGFFVGPMAEITVPIIGIGVDAAILYDNKVINAEDANKTLHYIDIPINLKYTLGLGDMAGVFVATGPQFAFNIGDRNIWHGDYKLKTSEFSWNIGIGAKLIYHLQIAYNYNIGLGKTAEVTPKGVADGIVTGKMKNNTHQISVAYMF